MNKLVKEYNSWLKENKNFILHLQNHDSALFTRFMPIYEVLNYLSAEYADNGLEFNEDLMKIFQIGLEYLHSQVLTCKLYLDKGFKKDFHEFLKFDRVVGYLLYIEDLRYELKEKNLKFNSKLMDKLSIYLEDLMDKRTEIPVNLNLYVDSEVHKLIDRKMEFNSIIDIFVEIAETLGIDLYYETEYVIGKDI